jgi:5-methyltetrahydrofolate--homocysteine methyltransferase
LIENIQAVTDTPICIDTANEKALEIAIKAVKKTPMVNSISGEPHRLSMIPIVAAHKCPAVALALDEQGVPKTVDDRLRVISNLLKETRKAGIEDDQLYFDPLAMTIATNTESGNIFFDSIRAIRREFPKVHITCGLSNISFGLPARAHINRVFMILSMQAGLDSAIMDPNDKELKSAMYSSELLLGLDKHCLKFTRAFRAGVFNK